MQQPQRTAGSRLPIMGGAMALSALLHGLALAIWICAHRPAEWPMSIGQKRGSLLVRLTPLAPPAPLAPSLKATAAPQARGAMLASKDKARETTLQTTRPIAPPKPAAQTSDPITPDFIAADADTGKTEPPQPQRIEPPAPVPDQAGARFANLFAPIVSRPMGRGGWGRPAPNPAAAAQASMQREQAIQGTRQAVQMRTEQLKAQLHEQALSGTCDVRIAMEQQAASVQCQHDLDRNRIAAIYQTALNLVANLPDTPASVCLHLVGSQVDWLPCAARPLDSP